MLILSRNLTLVFFAFFIIFLLTFTNISNGLPKGEIFDNMNNFESTNFFHVEKINDTWWFINPDGERFYSIGVSAIDQPVFCYDVENDFVKNTSKRLDKWNINTIMGNTDSFGNFSWIARFRWKHLSYLHDSGWSHDRFPDVFDSWWQNTVNTSAMQYAYPLKNDQSLIGYFTDNEMKWGPDTLDTLNLLDVYIAAENTTAGKKRVVNFLRQRYDNVDYFNTVWNLNIENFNELLNLKQLGINESWRLRSRNVNDILSIKSEYQHLLNKQYFDAAKDDIINFSALVAEKYFNVTDSALKKADPNHLNLGVRYHLLGVPEEVLLTSGKYLDVVSINYYRGFVKFYDTSWQALANKFDCVPLDNFMEKYSTSIERPIYISEYSFHINDGSNPVRLSSISPSKPVFSEEERYKVYEWYAKNCFKSKYVIGLAWFVFSDKYDTYQGFVDLWNDPYELFCEKMGDLNSKAIDMHKKPLNKIPDFFPFYINPNKIEYLKYNSKFLIKSLTNIFSTSNQDEIITRNVCENSKVNAYDILVGANYLSNYSSIQKAIDNASSSDTILVLNGTYKEKIIINKSINLVGLSAKNTTISGFYEDNIFTNDPAENNFVVTIKSDNVTFKGFNITSYGTFSDSSKNFRACAGIITEDNRNNLFSDNVFYKLGGHGGGGGIFALGADNLTILNNSFEHISGLGLILDSIYNSTVLHNNFIDNSIYGIWLSQSDKVTMHNNLIQGSKFGAVISKTINSKIDKNIFHNNNQKCLVLKSSSKNEITNNTFIKTKLNIINNKYESVMFFYQKDNLWEGNYWFKPRSIPKIIFGQIGSNDLNISFECDLKPATG